MKLIRKILKVLSQRQEERDLQRFKQAIDRKTPQGGWKGVLPEDEFEPKHGAEVEAAERRAEHQHRRKRVIRAARAA